MQPGLISSQVSERSLQPVQGFPYRDNFCRARHVSPLHDVQVGWTFSPSLKPCSFSSRPLEWVAGLAVITLVSNTSV